MWETPHVPALGRAHAWDKAVSSILEGGETMGNEPVVANSMDSITTALTTAFTTVAGDALDAIAAVLPIVMPVMGAIVVIGIAVGIFKRFVH
jgi:hypothetical protein